MKLTKQEDRRYEYTTTLDELMPCVQGIVVYVGEPPTRSEIEAALTKDNFFVWDYEDEEDEDLSVTLMITSGEGDQLNIVFNGLIPLHECRDEESAFDPDAEPLDIETLLALAEM